MGNNFRLDPQTKIGIIKYIEKFLQNKGEYEIKTYFNSYNLKCYGHDGQELSLKESLYESSDNALVGLYNNISSQQNIGDFFWDKNECLEVFKKEEFADLKVLLEECFNCIQSGNNIATVVIIRACLEMWLNKLEITEGNNQKKIDAFIIKIATDRQYKALKSQKSAINHLLHLYRENGNHAIHGRVKEAQEYIQNYCLEASLNLLCKLIENTILKDEIIEIKNKNREEDVKNINFDNKKQNIEQNNNDKNLRAINKN